MGSSIDGGREGGREELVGKGERGRGQRGRGAGGGGRRGGVSRLAAKE